MFQLIAVLSKSHTGESKLGPRQCGAPALVWVRMVLRKSGQATWWTREGGGGRRTETNWRSGATGGGMLPLLPTTQIHTSTHPLRFCSSLVCFSIVQVLSIINQSFNYVLLLLVSIRYSAKPAWFRFSLNPLSILNFLTQVWLLISGHQSIQLI